MQCAGSSSLSNKSMAEAQINQNPQFFSRIANQCHLPSLATFFTTHFNPNSSRYPPSPLSYNSQFTTLKLRKSTIDNAHSLKHFPQDIQPIYLIHPILISHKSKLEKRKKKKKDGEGTYRKKKIIFFHVMVEKIRSYSTID